MGLMCSDCVERKHSAKEFYRSDSTTNSKEEIQDFIASIKEKGGVEELALYC